jgi:hypothetical protein
VVALRLASAVETSIMGATDANPHPPPTAMPPSLSHQPESEIPRGLVLFPPGTPAGKKRRRLGFVAIYAVVVSLIVWPIFPAVARTFPLILGLPFSFAWVVLAILLGFAAVLGLYLSEASDRDGSR